MKKIFLTFILLGFLFGFNFVLAKTIGTDPTAQPSSSTGTDQVTVTPSNTTVQSSTTEVNQQFDQQTQTTTVNDTTGSAGTTLGGDCAGIPIGDPMWEQCQQNNPFGTLGSGGQQLDALNGNPGDPSPSGGGPQAGSAELSQCSAIKFLSILDIIVWIKCVIVVVVIPMIFVLAFLFFLWGVFRFIAAADSTKKEEGKKFILWGLVGLFVMTSIWGIIKILSTTLGIDSSFVPTLQTEYLKK